LTQGEKSFNFAHMAKKPSKKPVKKAPPKKAPAKKPTLKAAAKKIVKKLLSKPAAAAAKKPLPPPLKKGAKPAAPPPPVKKLDPKKAAAEAKAAAKAAKVKGKAPIPDKLVEKLAKKTGKGKAAEAEGAIAATDVEEEQPEETVLTDAEGRRFCRVRDCDQLAAVDTYCRYHYLLHWKKIQVRKKILTEGKLERYIEELTARYPDKFLDMLRKDLRSEKEFLGAIAELEIDESAMENDLEEEAQTYIDEVRGIEPAGRETEEDF